MKIIESDGIGVAALLAAARSIHAEIEGGNLVLGAAEIDGEDGPIAVVTALADRYTVGVTIERNPRLVDMRELEPQRLGSTHVGQETVSPHYFTGTADCVCVAACCSGVGGACICLTCEDRSHAHG